jgi:PAP2 superfamily C-terminal
MWFYFTFTIKFTVQTSLYWKFQMRNMQSLSYLLFVEIIISHVFVQLAAKLGVCKHFYLPSEITSAFFLVIYLLLLDSPKKLYVMHWLAWINAFIGILMVLLAHGHYSIDIIIAYYVTTRLFWTFHTLTNNGVLLKVSLCSVCTISFCFAPRFECKLLAFAFPFIVAFSKQGVRFFVSIRSNKLVKLIS